MKISNFQKKIFQVSLTRRREVRGEYTLLGMRKKQHKNMVFFYETKSKFCIEQKSDSHVNQFSTNVFEGRKKGLFLHLWAFKDFFLQE